MRAVEQLTELLAKSEQMVSFSGAGISTQSGIPDYRGPQGVWKTRQPVYFDEFMASEEKRVEYWDFKLESFEQFRAAKPNAAHAAIVELEKRGKVVAIVTQNIDGLHQAAGSRRVLELHGDCRRLRCAACGAAWQPTGDGLFRRGGGDGSSWAAARVRPGRGPRARQARAPAPPRARARGR